MDERLENCTFWTTRSDCHQKHFTRQAKAFSDPEPTEDQEKIAWRAGKTDGINSDEATICLHHEQVYGRVFERRVGDKCFDLFNKHRKKVKGDRIISLELAKKLKQDGLNVLPGWKCCRVCLEDASKQQRKLMRQRMFHLWM